MSSRRMLALVVFVVVVGCTSQGATETDTSLTSVTTLASVTTLTSVTTPPPTSATTTTHGCMNIPSVESAYLNWTKDGQPTREIQAWPYLGFGATWLLIRDGHVGSGSYLRADPEDETLGPSDDGLMDALRADFARGIDLPVSAEFTGFATAAVEVWIVADALDAAYIVPLPGTGLEVERWPAMPFPAFCH